MNHKNIVKVYDIGNEEGVYYLAMEYIQGCDLLDIVKSGHQPIHKIVDYIRQSAVGLGYAHSQNLVHRDVKPANLFADKQGVVKVLDLGLAKFSDAVSSSSELDDEKCVLGTADYIAPEQSYNSVDVDARADIYSLGCTLYFLLTRRVPFPDGSVPDRIRAHRSKEPKPIGELRSETPHEIVRICSKMMAKDVEQRYQTMNEVADDLGDWLEENDYEFEGSGGSSSAQPMPPKTSRPSGGGSAVHIHPRASKAGRSSSRHLHRRGGSSHRMIGGIGSPKSKKKSSSKRPSKKPAKDKIQVSGNDSSKPMVTPIKGTKKKNASHSRAPGRKSPSVSGGMSSARMMQKKSKKLAGKEWAVLGICGGVLLLVAVSLIIWVTSSS